MVNRLFENWLRSYGFSADFDAVPDVASADPAQNCVNGFCFRGVEKLYELMQANGLGDKKVWATEFGWIVNPPSHCLNDGSWAGRQWQIVSEEKQAYNLVGAFQYAAEHWPWMEAMFIFNLNFNTAGYTECEQMRFYGIQGRPAEAALRDMPKVTDPLAAELVASPPAIAALITPDQQPYDHAAAIYLSNIGNQALAYTATVYADSLSPVVGSTNGSIDPSQQISLSLAFSSVGRAVGTYSATVTVEATPGTIGAPYSVPVRLHIVDQIYRTYLPLVSKGG